MKILKFKTAMLLLIFAVFYNVQYLYAQRNSININGTIDSSIIKYFDLDSLVIKVHNSANKINDQEKIIKAKIGSDRRFKIEIPCQTKLLYLSFWALNKIKEEMVPIQFLSRMDYALDELYLFEHGDSVRLSIRVDGTMYFSSIGKGFEKLQLQNHIYNLAKISKSISARCIELQNLKRYNEILSLQYSAMETLNKLKSDLIKSYKKILPDNIYNIIYIDAISRTEYETLRSPYLVSIIENKQVFKNFYDPIEYNKYFATVDPKYLTQSGIYPESIFAEELSVYNLTNINSTITFKGFYDLLKRKFTGELRDRLLLLCFNDFTSETIKPNIDDMISTAYLADTKRSLLIWKEKQFSSAYPFELQDSNNKMHKLIDYKGKVVVVDFWFTGCTGCTRLNKAMSKIINRYKSNPDIVFITVSTDVNKAIWLKSVKSQKYTSSETINLFTNGLGAQHPLWKYYNFSGAPRQLIVGKKGDLISTAPPRPDVGLDWDGNNNPSSKDVLANPNAKAFIKILDDLLK